MHMPSDLSASAQEAYRLPLLMDESTSSAHVMEFLRAGGFSPVSTLSLLGSQATDRETFEIARDRGFVLVTRNVRLKKFPLDQTAGIILLPHAPGHDARREERLLRMALRDIADKMPRVPCAWRWTSIEYCASGLVDHRSLLSGLKTENGVDRNYRIKVESRRYAHG